MSTDPTPPPASPWWPEGTPESWLAGLHDAAAELFDAAPWSVVPDAGRRLFVIPVEDTRSTRLVAVVGQDGGTRGLRLFGDLEAHRVWLERGAGADAGPGATLPRHVSLDFVAGAELADGTRTRIIGNGWTVADDRAWPVLRVTRTDGSVGAPPVGDLPGYELILRAVTAALAEPGPWLRAWRDDGRHGATLCIDTAEDEIDVRVDTVVPAFMTLFDGDDAALLVTFERLDWSEGADTVDRDRLAELERTLIARVRVDSPDLVPERPHAGIAMLLDAAGDWFGKPVTGLSAADVEDIVLERVPRQVAVRPDEARAVLDRLGATLGWMTERHALAHGDACLELLAADDTTMHLVERLADTDSFDAEKRHYMDGMAAGHDMATEAGREAYLRQWRRDKMAAMRAQADDPYFDEPANERARPSPAQRKKRKANRKAARKSRKKNR